MSFSFCSFYKMILNADVKDMIRMKMNDIQGSFSWDHFDLSLSQNDVELSTFDFDDIIYQQRIWENIAKLSIDLWRDYDFYQHFMFESQYDDNYYIDRLHDLGFISTNGLWKNYHRPSDDVVLRNVFVFCLYRFMCAEMARSINVDKRPVINENEGNNVISKSVENKWICSNCTEENESSNAECKGCGRIDVNITNEIISQNNKNMETSIVKENINIVDENVLEKIGATSNNTATDCVRAEDYSVRGAQGGFKKPNAFQDKWTCCDCSYYNEYSALNCTVCTSKFDKGLWDCKHCTGKNSCKDGVCRICNERNVDIASDRVNVTAIYYCVGKTDLTSSNVDRRSRNERSVSSLDRTEDQWYCSECATMNLYGLDNCRMCSKSRMKFGRWLCDRCTLRNKFSDKKCDSCQAVDKKKVYQCQKKADKEAIEKPKSDDNKGKWQCLHLNCKNMNKSKDEYCSVCKLSRHLSRGVGDLVEKMTKKGPEHVWICHSCNKFNDKDAVKCAASGCSKNRRDPIICRNCTATSHTRTENCVNCGDKFC